MMTKASMKLNVRTVLFGALLMFGLAIFGVRGAEACTFTCSVPGPGGGVYPTRDGWVCQSGDY
ncbi:MAG TPA: hypothetical protein VNU25_01800, partial [Candidatus Paceibacterota bacterium]|nr:hypothetical protein [Candidatus Paceibacterota bacterium]